MIKLFEREIPYSKRTLIFLNAYTATPLITSLMMTCGRYHSTSIISYNVSGFIINFEF